MKNSKRRVVILGDSLGMPRPDEEIAIQYEETYPYLLRSFLKEWEVISVCKRGNNVENQVHPQYLFDDIEVYNPKYVVIYLGVVDCAPRLFSQRQQKLLRQLPGAMGKRIISFFSNHRSFFTRLCKKVYVTKVDYQKYMEKLINFVLAKDAIPIIINIVDTNEENKARSYNFTDNILEYNKILLALTQKYKLQLIDIYNLGLDFVLPDGIHLNVKGNEEVARRIAAIISGKKQSLA